MAHDLQLFTVLVRQLLSGVEHKVKLVCCSCEPVSLTLVRARLWPATPQHPRFAFTFELLD